MICPECGHDDTRVIDSRPADMKIRRRRECLKCLGRFTTYEIVEDIPVMVIKKDGGIEPFNSQKLIDRVLRATAKRPVKLKAIESMVEGIQNELKNEFKREVSSERIGEMLMGKLMQLDHVAYVRFASVYRDFEDVDGFIKFISELRNNS